MVGRVDDARNQWVEWIEGHQAYARLAQAAKECRWRGACPEAVVDDVDRDPGQSLGDKQVTKRLAAVDNVLENEGLNIDCMMGARNGREDGMERLRTIIEKLDAIAGDQWWLGRRRFNFEMTP